MSNIADITTHAIGYMPFWFQRFRWSTSGWPAEAALAYLYLLCEQYSNGSLPVDPNQLDEIAPGTLAHWQRIERKFPVCEDGRRRNARCNEMYEQRISTVTRRSAASSKANAQRWSSESDPNRMAIGSESDPKRIRNGSESECIVNGIVSVSVNESVSENTSEGNHNQHGAVAAPPARARGGVVFDYATAELSGITDSHRERWAAAYPAVEINQQVAAAAAWLAANPKKRKKNIERFLTNWLSAQQERGGVRQHRVSSMSPRTIEDVPEHLRF